MSKTEANKAVKQAKISGYYHHSYELEKKFLHSFISGDRQILQTEMDLATYVDVLAPHPFRAMKNSAICMIAIICRAVIEAGVDVEQSFSLSDYYINELENQSNEENLRELFMEMLHQYMDLVQERYPSEYSLPVLRSLRYINQHLYGSCLVSDVAKAINLNCTYLSALFISEVDIEMSYYIREKKLNEAKILLSQTSYSVAELAEMFGYCDSASFSNAFKKMFGKSPKNFIGLRTPMNNSTF